MNYSQAWQDKLNFHNSLEHDLDWETVINKKYVNLTDSKSANLIFLDNPVWVEIHDMVSYDPFRKIKAISKYNVYFDGTFKGCSNSCALGCLHDWTYTIDGHTLDLTGVGINDNNQLELIDLIKTYSDGFTPQIPKGILKIPTIF